MSNAPENIFQAAHRPLEALLRRHLLALIAGDFEGALRDYLDWLQALQAHVTLEETRLFPAIPADARWPARVYRLEHKRILELAQDQLLLLRQVAARPPQRPEQAHGTALDLLDAAHALRHLLEHHHQREEKALAQELPPALQQDVLGAP